MENKTIINDLNWMNDTGRIILNEIIEILKDGTEFKNDTYVQKPDEKLDFIKTHINVIDYRRLYSITKALRTMTKNCYSPLNGPDGITRRKIFSDYNLLNGMYREYKKSAEEYLDYYKYRVCRYDFFLMESLMEEGHEFTMLLKDITDVYNKIPNDGDYSCI